MKYRILPLATLLGTSAVLLHGCSRAPVPERSAKISALPTPSSISTSIPTALPISAPKPKSKLSWDPPPRGRSVIRMPRQIKNPPQDFLKVPKGWRVQLVVGGLKSPRWLTVASNGDIFVVESHLDNRAGRHPNRVLVLHDTGTDGVADQQSVWAEGLNLPFGIAFHGGYLYVANTGSVVRWPYTEGQMQASGPPEIVLRGVPERGMRQHWTRNILFSDADKRMYLTIGSKENADMEEELRGTIVAYGLDATGKPGGSPQIIARGMRNPVGLALQPLSGKLWTVVNERDYLGDKLVPDFCTEVTPGGFYGWPYYFLGPHHDPRLPSRPDLKAKVLMPDVLLDAHSAPLGLVFAPNGRTALIARHGSLNRRRKVGYDVGRIRFDEYGRADGPFQPVITGWLPDPFGAEVNGRPAGLALAKDGSLLIADDWGGRIWRIVPGSTGF